MPYNIPIGNVFSNQLFATGSTVDLLKWDNTCLDSMNVPEGIERTDVINCILEKYGDETLAHPDPVYMKHYVGTWSKRRLPIWIKLLETVNYDYNPIHNYNRTEEITDTTNREYTDDKSGTTENKIQSSDTGTSTVAGNIDRTEGNENKASAKNVHSVSSENENKVSAENVNTYQPNERTDNTTEEVTDNTVDEVKNTAIKEVTSQTTNTSASANDTGEGKTTEHNNGNETVTYTHRNITKGNIGVTTTQQMIESQRKIVRYSVIEEIASEYRDTFCLGIY